MIHIKLLIIGLLIIKVVSGQTRAVEKKYDKAIYTSNDSFVVRFSNAPYTIPFRVSERDTTDMGTDGAIGLYAAIHYGKDSLRFDYKNLPFTQTHWITIQSPKGKTIYKLHFNQVNAAFSREYIEKNKGLVQIEIPEVYELANIIWTLSPSGQKAENLNKQGAYYQTVLSYFKPYLNHPLFKKLNFTGEDYLKNYYDFRDNSFAYSFKKNQLVCKVPYYYVTGNNENFNSLFKQLLPLIDDFAKKSNYKSFYSSNKQYYNEQIQQQKAIIPIKNMWEWLENNFPNKNVKVADLFPALLQWCKTQI